MASATAPTSEKSVYETMAWVSWLPAGNAQIASAAAAASGMSRRWMSVGVGTGHLRAHAHTSATMMPAAMDPTTCVSMRPANTVVGAMPMTNDDTAMPSSGVPITETNGRRFKREGKAADGVAAAASRTSARAKANGAHEPTASSSACTAYDAGTGRADAPRLTSAAVAMPTPQSATSRTSLSWENTFDQAMHKGTVVRPARAEDATPSASTTGEATSTPSATSAV